MLLGHIGCQSDFCTPNRRHTSRLAIVIDEKNRLCKTRVRAMLSAFKKFFSKSPQPDVAPRETRVAPMPTPVSRATTPTQSHEPAAPAGAPADGIPVNLKAVVALMPDNLKKRLDKNLNGKELIFVSRGDALRQLPLGSVTLPFSDIVKQAPNMFLTPDAEML